MKNLLWFLLGVNVGIYILFLGKFFVSMYTRRRLFRELERLQTVTFDVVSMDKRFKGPEA